MRAGMTLMRRIATELEPWTGLLAGLEVPGYTDDPKVVDRGDGIYTAEDWGQARRSWLSFAREPSEPDIDRAYLRHIYAVESMNVVGALALAQAFDFGLYRSIFELGCGDMAQAHVIHGLYPGTRYVATDLDPYVIEQCGRVGLLRDIEKRVVDVTALDDDAPPFAGFDLVMSWGMEYALNDAQLLRLFEQIGRARAHYLLCSATAIGFGKYGRQLLARRRQDARLKAKQIRFTGWMRSPGKLRRLAARAGLRSEVLGRFGYHFCLLFQSGSAPAPARPA